MKYRILIYPTNQLFSIANSWNEAIHEVLFYSNWEFMRLFIEKEK